MINMADKKSYDKRFALIRTIDSGQLLTDAQASGATVMDVEEGGFFTYKGNTYCVREKNTYRETDENHSALQDYTVTELTCMCMETGATTHLEWEYDDELEVSVTLDRIKFRQITDDEGHPIDGDDLDQIVEDEDTVIYNGEKFYYEDDWAALYTRNTKQEKVFMYEFENESGTRSLTIEEWAGSSKEAYQIYVSQPVTPENITLITRGGPVNETQTQ